MFQRALRRFGDRQQRWIQDKKPGTPSRSRGLGKFDGLFGTGKADAVIEAASAQQSHPRVVEIGCGEGRLLLELLRKYPHIETHGINKQRWPVMTGRSSFGRAAVRFGIFDKHELSMAKLPMAHFYNAEALDFADGSVDLVISQVAIPYVRRKDRLIEEVWRVLRPGGRALLHIDTRVADPPDYLRGRTPRFVVYRQDQPVDLADMVEELRADGYRITYSEVPGDGRVRVLLEIEKTGIGPLSLGLDLDSRSTFKLQRLKPQSETRSPVFWGCRSVFQRRE